MKISATKTLIISFLLSMNAYSSEQTVKNLANGTGALAELTIGGSIIKSFLKDSTLNEYSNKPTSTGKRGADLLNGRTGLTVGEVNNVNLRPQLNEGDVVILRYAQELPIGELAELNKDIVSKNIELKKAIDHQLEILKNVEKKGTNDQVVVLLRNNIEEMKDLFFKNSKILDFQDGLYKDAIRSGVTDNVMIYREEFIGSDREPLGSTADDVSEALKRIQGLKNVTILSMSKLSATRFVIKVLAGGAITGIGAISLAEAIGNTMKTEVSGTERSATVSSKR